MPAAPEAFQDNRFRGMGTWLNRMLDEAKRRLRFTHDHTIESLFTPAGIIIARPRRPGSGLWAQLSGATSPYSWTEQDPDVAGGFTPTSGGLSGTNNAYEVNGLTGLNDKFEWLILDVNGDYRFQHVRSVSSPCISSIIFHATDCRPGNFEGLEITLTKGMDTFGPQTTGFDGKTLFGPLDDGTYDYSYPATDQYDAGSGTVVLGCDTVGVEITLVKHCTKVRFQVLLCCPVIGCPAPDTHVQWHTDDASGDGMTDDDGIYEVCLPDGDYTWTADHDGYASGASGHFTVSGQCILTPQKRLFADEGLFCFPDCQDAIPDPLTITFGSSAFFCDWAGLTKTVNFDSVSLDPTTLCATYVYKKHLIIGDKTADIEVHIENGPDCEPVMTVIWPPCFPFTGGTLTQISGTAACPVSCVTEIGGDPDKQIAVSE